jgi:exodeoxyribonuclease VII small subunit
MAFEQIMANLEKSVSNLEQGDMSLEASMKEYEQGINWVRLAQNKLKTMEGKMEELLADGSKKTIEVKTESND